MIASPNFRAEKVWLAPMSGSTDAAFRRQVAKFGARAVVSEMVASDALTASRPDVVRRICRHDGSGQWIVQLAARRPDDMRNAAALLRDLGVDVIDINMGCPSRQVTGGKSGSALMKEPDLAFAIIAAAIEGAGHVPVTLKMRLGWDEADLNAPSIATEAEILGIQMITVHGRTRCQFYKGDANWSAIKPTVSSVSIPVIANGDIGSFEDAATALGESDAYGVMIGRAALGRPWIVGNISKLLDGEKASVPSRQSQLESLVEQIEDSASLYGQHLGLRIVRKHISAAIDHLDVDLTEIGRRRLRSELCQLEEAGPLIRSLNTVYSNYEQAVAA